jgi:prevent-host-death family protein
MRTLSLAEAKMHLSAVVDQVEAGEEIVITRRGRRVARIVPERALQPAGAAAILDKLRAFVMSQAEQPRPASEVVRALRHEARS